MKKTFFDLVGVEYFIKLDDRMDVCTGGCPT